MRKTDFKKTTTALVITLIVLACVFIIDTAWKLTLPAQSKDMDGENMEKPGNIADSKDIKEIYLAGGCFWGVEAYMARIDGVIDQYRAMPTVRQKILHMRTSYAGIRAMRRL